MKDCHRLLAPLLLIGFGAVVGHADWPTARGNGGRTGANQVGPTANLTLAWTISTLAPAPAWPREARGSLWQKLASPLTARAADDLAPLPVIARGSVVFGTTHDEVRCVSLTNGATRWQYFCGGPVRYAPAISGSRVFVGADDGFVHALDLETGALRWKTPVGPDAAFVSGNGRLVHPCPVRTGLLTSGELILVGAGLFPLEGTYLAALNANSGQVQWRRQLGNHSPQGYLADAGAEVVLPMGRAAPGVYRKEDGTRVREVPSSLGTFAVVDSEETLSGPGPTGSIQGGNARTGTKLVAYPGTQMAVTPKTAFLLNPFELTALDRQALRTNQGNFARAQRWKSDCAGGSALIVAGRRVYVGTREGVRVLDADTGSPQQTLAAPGPVIGLAADAMGLVVSCQDGTIRGFLENATTSPPTAQAEPPGDEPRPSPEAPAALDHEVSATWTQRLPLRRGLALWAGKGDPSAVLQSLVHHTQLHLVLALSDTQVDPWRRRLWQAGWLGPRASVIARRRDGTVPVIDQLFNVVIADDLPVSEANRLVCPSPSGWLVFSGRLEPSAPSPNSGVWTHLYGTSANTCASSQPLTSAPRLRWFGGHGPEQMPDRHTRGHAPLAAGGLLLSVAEDGLIATDSHNGTVRWHLELPGSMRYAMPYDGGYVVLAEDGRRAWAAVRDALWEIDTLSGQVVARHPGPMPGLHWGWVARAKGTIYGSAVLPDAPRHTKEYDLVDLDYRSGRPLVCSESLFRQGENLEAPAWVYRAKGVLANPTLCVDQGRVYAVEARGPAAQSERRGRLTCREILADAYVVSLDGPTGRLLWERRLEWNEAEDILGLAVEGDHLILSAARSADEHAAYHLRCWSSAEGRERWQAQGRNPIKDLFHGQQVKRPVLVKGKVAFESDVFDLTQGTRWVPEGEVDSWILARPGHACGGMTGVDDGLLFRADNPTFFAFADGSFTRLAPTRPGCWLNMLPAEGGVLIPEASASCVCGYPIQTSMGFAFGMKGPVLLPEAVP